MTLSLSLTSFAVFASFGSIVLGMLMAFLSVFLIMLILLQRGRGGGLSGALGGAGGQSAFGSKAGDTFTVLTISLAGVWIFVCAFAMWSLGIHTPSVARMIPTSVEAGPGSDDPEDIASGLVIPTGDGDADEEASGDAADLIPAQEAEEAGLDSPAGLIGPAPAESDAAATAAGAEAETAEQPTAEEETAEEAGTEAPTE